MYLLLHVLLRKTLKLSWTKSSEKIPHSLSANNCSVIVCVSFVWREDNLKQVYAKIKGIFRRKLLSDVEQDNEMKKRVKYIAEK